MAYECIKIRLIRKPSLKDKSDDDIITVSRTYCDGVFKMKFQDKLSDTEFVTTLTKKGLVKYISTLFKVLTLDTEPYNHAQFFFPQYPSIMVDHDDFFDEELQTTLKEATRSTIRAWHMNTIHEMWNYEDA